MDEKGSDSGSVSLAVCDVDGLWPTTAYNAEESISPGGCLKPATKNHALLTLTIITEVIISLLRRYIGAFSVSLTYQTLLEHYNHCPAKGQRTLFTE
jgi:hypothetical protein